MKDGSKIDARKNCNHADLHAKPLKPQNPKRSKPLKPVPAFVHEQLLGLLGRMFCSAKLFIITAILKIGIKSRSRKHNDITITMTTGTLVSP